MQKLLHYSDRFHFKHTCHYLTVVPATQDFLLVTTLYIGGNGLCLYNDTYIIFLFTATKPKLSELRSLKCQDGTKIEIIPSIAPVWKDFAVLLEFDDDGTKLNLIEANQRVNGPAACCTEMFQTWLKGAGRQPASWDLVIELLEDCEQTYLAQQVKEAL